MQTAVTVAHLIGIKYPSFKPYYLAIFLTFAKVNKINSVIFKIKNK